MGKWGSASAWFLCDGYNMVANKLQALRYRAEAVTEPTHGIGDTWEEHTPAGMGRAELVQEGAFFDSSTSGGLVHQMYSSNVALATTSAERIVCLGMSAKTSGNDFVGLEGVFNTEYEVLAQNGKLTRANATYVVDGALEHGTIIRTDDSSSTATFYLDDVAATTGGGAAYVQVTALTVSGDTGGITITVNEASATSGSYTAIATFDAITGVGAWRTAATDDTILRYLSCAVASTGTISDLKAFVGVTRK